MLMKVKHFSAHCLWNQVNASASESMHKNWTLLFSRLGEGGPSVCIARMLYYIVASIGIVKTIDEKQSNHLRSLWSNVFELLLSFFGKLNVR